MTEKRFRLGYVCGDYGLIDNNEWIDLHSMSENSEKNVQICINKMNELADENEQLRTKSNAYLQDIEVYREENTHLKLENEQLKTRLSQLNKENGKLFADYSKIILGDAE